MSATTDQLLAAAKAATIEQTKLVLASSKKNFLDTFRDFINPQDLLLLDKAFEGCTRAKWAQFSAKTDDEAAEAVATYEANLNVIETIGNDYEVIGKAKAGVFVRSVAHSIISGAFAVAGAVLQAGLGIVLPGIGSLIGAGVNAGLQHVVAYFLED